MRLRDYLAGIFLFFRMWPPIWVGEASNIPSPRGEVGRLVEARYTTANPRRVFLVIQHDAKRFLGCLMFKDDSSAARMSDFLQACCGMRIKDIGDLEITFPVSPPVRRKHALDRPAFWIIPALMRP
jgi:hypothetical protein